MENIKIIIVDDHPFVRKGIITVLDDEPGIEVINEASSGEELLQLLEKDKPNVVIVDFNLQGINGIETVKRIKAQYPEIEIILLTMYKEEDLFNASLDVDIKAYLLKENAIDEVISAIQIVTSGETYYSKCMNEFLVNRKKRKLGIADEKSGINSLTQKEIEILKLIANSKSSKEISAELFISFKTVEKHRTNICKKLNLTGINSLLKFALENRFKL